MGHGENLLRRQTGHSSIRALCKITTLQNMWQHNDHRQCSIHHTSSPCPSALQLKEKQGILPMRSHLKATWTPDLLRSMTTGLELLGTTEHPGTSMLVPAPAFCSWGFKVDISKTSLGTCFAQ